jgi:hypothetical protein
MNLTNQTNKIPDIAMLRKLSLSFICVLAALTAGAASSQDAANGNSGAAVTAPALPPGGNPAAGAEGAPAPAAAPASGDFKSLDQEVQALKKDVLDLNRELFVLEEELLFPANTQVAVFVSMDVGEFFALDSVTLKVDNKEVANYLYTEREAQALLKGGVHRVYIGNLKAGEHELIALFTGQGPNQRDYRRGATIKLEKGVGAKYVELKISDKAVRAQPEFIVKEWE